MVELKQQDGVVQLSLSEWEDRVRAGRVPPDTQLRFGPVTGSAFARAGDLEMYKALVDDRLVIWRRRFAEPAVPWMTAILLGVQIRIAWLAQLPETGPWMQVHLVRWTSFQLEAGEVWRMLTMGFFHTGLAHVVMNMLWLGYVGWYLERAIGPALLLFVYVEAVLGGSLLSTFLRPSNPSLGASGGVFGLIAASVIFGLLRPQLVPEDSRRFFGKALLPYLIVMFISGFSSTQTDNACHLGGLLTGGLLGWILDPPGYERAHGRNARTAVAGALISAATLLGLAVYGPRVLPIADASFVRAEPQVAQGEAPPPPPPADALRWSAPNGWSSEQGLAGVLGFRSPTGRAAWGVTETAAEVVLDARRVLAQRAHRLGPDAVSIGDDSTATAAHAAGVWEVHAGEEIWHVQLDVVTRGRHARVQVWEVNTDGAVRLGPLRERLEATVVWPEPTLAAAPAPTAVRDLLPVAEAHADAGDLAGALSLLDAAIAGHPESGRALATMVKVVGWYGPPDALARLDHALAADVSSEVTAEVVTALSRLGKKDEARGLAELAWRRSPGDGAIAQARAWLSLPNGLDADGTPRSARWELLDASGALAPRIGPPASPPVGPLTRDAAAALGAHLRAGRVALIHRLEEQLAAADPGLAATLLTLAETLPPVDAAASLSSLRSSVHEAAGSTPEPALDPAAAIDARVPWYRADLPALTTLDAALAAIPDEAALSQVPPARW